MSGTETPRVRFASAVGWATVMSWGQDGLSALTTFVLALILGPSNFGLVVVALSITGVVELFVSQGYLGAIVQRAKLDDVDLDSVFWVTVGLGAALTAGTVLMSDAVASFYGLARLTPVIQVLALCVLIRGLTVVQEAKLTREMDFKSLALRTNLSVIVGAVAGISLALAGWGVWALVGQSLARGISGLIVLWRAARWTPRLRFNAAHTWEMTVFSIKYFPATMFDFLSAQAEPLIMGKFFGEAAVGIYRLAMRLLDLVITVVTRALWYVSFPYFSESRSDLEKLRGRVADCLRYSVMFSLPVLAVLGLESTALVEILGSQWADAAGAIRILCIYAALRSLVLFAGPLLVALGRPQAFSSIMAIQCTALCVGVAAAGLLLGNSPSDVQVAGIAWTRVGVYVAVFLPFALWVIVSNAKMHTADIVRCVLPGLTVGAAAGGIDLVLVALDPWLGMPVLTGLIVRTALAGLCAGLAILAVDPVLRKTASDVIQSKTRVAAETRGAETGEP